MSAPLKMGAIRRKAAITIVLSAGCLAYLPVSPPCMVHGRVRDASGPLAGVHVHFQGRGHGTITDASGRFRLFRGREQRPVTAAKPGYRIAWMHADAAPADIFLEPLPVHDHEDYAWIDPAPDTRRSNNCGNCHAQIYREWDKSAHARSAWNPRVLRIVDGRDSSGRSHPTWNLRVEHPLGVGVCASCHAPTYTDPGLEYDLGRVRGTAARGVHCDYCHKIVDAPVDKLGTRFGRDGLVLLRPAAGELLTFGPFDDAVRYGESFASAPLYKESRYCASCHEGIVFGVHVYGTYSEWRESPAGRNGQTCQACHMTATGQVTNVAPGHGGSERDPASLARHDFPGATIDMLRHCLKVNTSITRNKSLVRVAVEIEARDVGHRVPTGFIDRNLVLVVEGCDGKSRAVCSVAGPRLPAEAGRDFVGLAGAVFAKQLMSPQSTGPIPFWQAHGTLQDTRL
jgi:cytochrome c554/c'-like protein